MNAQAQQTTQQRIRGPKLAVFIKRANGVPFEEGLARANAENRVIASNKRLTKALVDTHEWQGIREVFACWSGTMTAYVEPDTTLGKQVEYVDPDTSYRWVFSVPEAHQGKKNAILVAEHPDYDLEIDGKNRIVHAAKVDLVENFPASDGWYKGDPNYNIPTTGQEGSDRHLRRIAKRVGPARHDYYYFDCDYGRLDVNLTVRPSDRFGVAVEASEVGGVPQVEISNQELVKVADPQSLLQRAAQLRELAILLGQTRKRELTGVFVTQTIPLELLKEAELLTNLARELEKK